MIKIITLFNQVEVIHSQNWMFFIVVVFGITGYCFTEKYKEIDTSGIALLTIGMVAFSIYNGDAKIDDVTIYNHLLGKLQQPEVDPKFFEAVEIYEPKILYRVVGFHILISILAILVIIRKYLPGIFKRSTRDKIVG